MKTRLTRWLTLAPLAALLATHQHDGVQAQATSCDGCKSKVCMAPAPALVDVVGGANDVELSLCVTDKSAQFSVDFSLDSTPVCDSNNATRPRFSKVLGNLDTCDPKTPCKVRVGFVAPLDFALVPVDKASRLLATAVVKGDAPADPVHVANIPPNPASGPSLNAGPNASVSMCMSSLNVTGTGFSLVKECNVVKTCSGDGTKCFDVVNTQGLIDNVAYASGSATGVLRLSDPGTCDPSPASDAVTPLNAKIQVGSRSESKPVVIAQLSAPVGFTIGGVSGLGVGATSVSLKVDTVCNGAVVVSVGGADTLKASGNVSNGSIVVTFSSAVPPSLKNKQLEFSFSQCNGKSNVFKANVSATTLSGASAGSYLAGTASPGGGTSQQASRRVGMPGAVYIGIGVAVVAVLGFAFECWYHKRRTPRAPVGHSSEGSIASSGHGHTSSV